MNWIRPKWRRRRRPPCPPPPQPNYTNAINFGWRAHQAQEAWTAKVDVKASIVLALDGAMLVAIIAGQNKDGVLTALSGWRDVAVGAAACLILAALVFAGLVVRPALGPSRQHLRDFRDHVIYFGHLRHWDPEQLAVKLQSLTQGEETFQLAQQLVSMSSRNWWKHRLLQWALYATAAAAVTVAVATFWPR